MKYTHMHIDGIQDTLSQNMIPAHMEYFMQKNIEKWLVQEGLSDLPLKQVIKPSCESCTPIAGRKE